jgi:hypothetical protein
VRITPGYVLDFASSTTSTLAVGVENNCAGDVPLGTPALRRGLPDFTTSTAAQTILQGSSASLPVSYARTSPASAEDTLLFNLAVAGMVIRYPVTLSAATQP